MLTIGQLMPFTKAASIGLIDTLVPADKLMDEALAEVEVMNTAVPFSRAITKQRMRQAHIDWLEERRENDIEGFVRTTQSDMVQSALGKYLASLKAKSKPKAKL
jgi:enoyl-CoA hydratase/carnithine racemase